MKLPLINAEDALHGAALLEQYYANKLIPADKKNYLSKIADSVGPYMGIHASDGSTHYLLDACSQISTLGHGFNSSLFFGPTQFLDSWTNDSNTFEFIQMRKSFEHFFSRKLNWEGVNLHFTHSGAEANEWALGQCYESRLHLDASHVLAFEGSFHGRMMVTIAATWNKSKREPFEWPNYKAEYVKYPELFDSETNVAMPANWREVWGESALRQFIIPEQWCVDSMMQKEVDSLLSIRTKLLSKKIFAIIIEPMQCEGGENYSSNRFHTALLLMARSFRIPIVFDEVQTGFHLGTEFFWHRQFDLRDSAGVQLNPDFVICAKKAQLGIVLSSRDFHLNPQDEEVSVISAYRGYIHALSLDQCQLKIKELEKSALHRLEALLKNHQQYIFRPRQNGQAFAFDLKDETLLNQFVDLRFKHGLLFYPAGNRTLRFRLNTAFGEKDLDFLFKRLDCLCRELFLKESHPLEQFVETDAPPSDIQYLWHELLISLKIERLKQRPLDRKSVFDKIQRLVIQDNDLSLFEFNADNIEKYQEVITDLETRVYEPARQTEFIKFKQTVLHKNSICLGLLNNRDQKLIGIAFAGPIKLYPMERAARLDPHFQSDESLYMLDLTIDPDIQSKGLGRSLKYALSALSITKGIKRIQGRNRDRLAGAMININLSLGALEQEFIREDYADLEEHRDTFYYTSKTCWENPPIRLSSATTMPLSIQSMDEFYRAKQMPFAVNKICLSNFVSENYLFDVSTLIDALPEFLRHSYSSSGQSECVDKIAKTIWVTSPSSNKTQNMTRMLTFKNHFFGNGSVLSRSLGQDLDPYFEVTKLSHPTQNNYREILKQVETELSKGIYLAVWIEPTLQKTMEKVPFPFLVGLRLLTSKYQIALVFNETASQFYRFSEKHFFASNFLDISPDVGLIYLGGQAGVVFARENFYFNKPLMMISTWDGDEFSFNSYFHSFKTVTNNSEDYKKTCKQFHKRLLTTLSRYEVDQIQLENGFGYFKGSIPTSLSDLFIHNGEHYLVCPTYDSMREFLDS